MHSKSLREEVLISPRSDLTLTIHYFTAWTFKVILSPIVLNTYSISRGEKQHNLYILITLEMVLVPGTIYIVKLLTRPVTSTLLAVLTTRS